MAEARSGSRIRRGRRVRHAVALAGAVICTVALAAGCSSPTTKPTTRTEAKARSEDKSEAQAGTTSTPTPTPTSTSTPTPVSALPASLPERISVPGLHIDADLGTVGLDAEGVMQTPPYDKPMQADWYKEGPTPGEKGAAAIVGHRDTPQTSAAVFHNLGQLRRGNTIEVRRADGSTAVFTVDEVDTFAKDAFPTEKVYGGTGRAELRLITCGGRLNADRHWDSNVVVFAHLTGSG
jgi:LPXTG-site transpeptidase (sortase) family protein